MSNEPTQAAPPRTVAVIDIGSSAVRMAIAEIHADGAIRILENASRPVALGKDVFVSRRISRSTALQALKALEGFRELMSQYGITTYRAVGTSALREAEDRETFLDRIYMRTGIDVEVIEGIEENRLVFAAVHQTLGEYLKDEDAFLIEVGSGDTDITVLRKGEVAVSHTLRSGSLRLLRERGDQRAGRDAFVRALRQRVANAADVLAREFQVGQVDNFVAMGSEARLAATRVGERVSENYATMTPRQFREFIREVSRMSQDEIVDKYGATHADAETLAPALLVYERFLEITRPKRILVPMVSMRDGLLIEMAQLEGVLQDGDFARQIIASARQLARKFHYDKAHSEYVADLALQIFQEMRPEHKMGPREQLLLHVAAILHDVGMFVGTSGHHKHGQYLVENSEVFGLRREDMRIVGNVVRYHRRAMPGAQHPEYAALSRQERVTVSKLAAILRVADCLDRGHRQQSKRLEFEREGETLVIVMPGATDISLERAGLPEKANLFERVFGMEVVVRSRVEGVRHEA